MDVMERIRIQVKDLPRDLWVELSAEDLDKVMAGKSVEVTMRVREVSSYARLRWKSSLR